MPQQEPGQPPGSLSAAAITSPSRSATHFPSRPVSSSGRGSGFILLTCRSLGFAAIVATAASRVFSVRAGCGYCSPTTGHPASPVAKALGAAVVFVDLDKFKDLNDRLGHAAGDRLLTHVGERLLGAVRDDDLVGRLGGDEFLIICRQVRSSDEALAIGERPAAASTADALIARADEAMYRSKRYLGGAPTLAPELAMGSDRPGSA